MAEFGLTDAEFNTAVYVFAHYLGIDLEKEQVLLHVAETALRTLPDGWSLGIGDGDNEGIPYFFNEETGESVWKHPKEQIYLKKVKDERRRQEAEAEDKRKQQQQQQQQPQVRQQQSRSRSRSPIPVSKGVPAAKKPVKPEDEVLTFDDFELDDDETPMKQPIKRTAVDVAVAVAPSATGKKDGGAFGMQADDFYSDDEDDTRPAAKIGPERDHGRDPAAAPAPAPAPALAAKASSAGEKNLTPSYSSYSPSAKEGSGKVRAPVDRPGPVVPPHHPSPITRH